MDDDFDDCLNLWGREIPRKRSRMSLAGAVALLLVAMTCTFLVVGCCTVDHEDVAARAEFRRQVAAQVVALPDAALTPGFARAYAIREHDAWEITRARFGGAPVSSATAARVGSR